MNARFKGVMTPEWSISDAGITFKNMLYPFHEMTSVKEGNIPTSSLTNGVIQVWVRGKTMPLTLAYAFKEKEAAQEAIRFIYANFGTEEIKQQNQAKKEQEAVGLIYDLQGVRGRYIKVYDNRAILTVKAGLGSFITGNVSDGEKTIYYKDCIGIQFKESGFQIGYIQLETASRMMNMSQNNFFNENTFTFDTSVQTNEKMREVADYIRSRVESYKNGSAEQPVVAQVSVADELKKFKELLDMGVITQEEFDAQKKRLLGL